MNQPKIKVLDAKCGTGKSESIITYINEQPLKKKFLIIAIYLTEVRRYEDKCLNRKFKTPFYKDTKLEDVKNLLRQGENIITTHALFSMFDKEVVEICKSQNYTLVMDESINVVDTYKIGKNDYNALVESFVDVDEATGVITWKEEYKDYNDSKFIEEKKKCDTGSFVRYGNNTLIWLYSIDVFKCFTEIFILTYMFDAQILRCYFDYYKMDYKHIYVQKDSYGEYSITEDKSKAHSVNVDYTKLFNIFKNKKYNHIGDDENALSKSWYNRNKNNKDTISRLRKNLSNYFNVKCSFSNERMWTTFKEFEKMLAGKGYVNSHAPSNIRATNEYINKNVIAYMINKFLNPVVKNFFKRNGITINEYDYALSEMIQFIFRSAVRVNNEVWIYMPSIRMRNMLHKWIADNSVCLNSNEENKNMINEKGE